MCDSHTIDQGYINCIVFTYFKLCLYTRLKSIVCTYYVLVLITERAYSDIPIFNFINTLRIDEVFFQIDETIRNRQRTLVISRNIHFFISKDQMLTLYHISLSAHILVPPSAIYSVRYMLDGWLHCLHLFLFLLHSGMLHSR